MATLTGQSIASSYEQLLHTDTDGGGNGTTLVPIKDGDNGTTFSLELATTSIAIGATHKLYLDGGGNTYITESSADTIQLATGGTTALTIGSDQIATFANNVNLLDNKALTLGTDGDAQIWNDGSNTYIRNNTSDQDIIFRVNDGGTANTEVMRIDGATANVGIGTDSPSELLHLQSVEPVLRFTDSDDSKYHHIFASSDDLYISADRGTSGTGGNIFFRVGSTSEKMRIDGSGNVSIGGHSASGVLDVRKNSSKIGFGTDSSADFGEIYFGSGVAINFAHETNDNAGGIINYRGYDNGISQFRDLTIADGKGNTVAFFDGSEKSTAFSGLVTVDSGGTSRITIDGNNTSGDDGNLQIYGHTTSASRAYISINNGVSSGGQNWYVGALRGNNSFAIGRDNDFGTNTDFSIDSSGNATFDNDVTIGDATGTPDLKISGTNTGTNLAATGHGASNIILHNASATDDNFSFIDGNNSNDAVDSRIAFIHDSHSSRHGAIAFLLHNGSSLAEKMRIDKDGDVNIVGALSKGSGSFKIDHPLESKKDTHNLVHSFVEAPQADNIYRGKATLSSGSVEINLDTVSGMSEGTFVLLNTDIQCFTSNESDWDAVKGSVSGNILTISCQNADSTATVSWLVIGERQDQHMLDTNWTDENGKIIVEPLKN